jgi:hypothetical protein
MNPVHTYKAFWNGEETVCFPRLPGALEIHMPKGSQNGQLKIIPINI